MNPVRGRMPDRPERAGADSLDSYFSVKKWNTSATSTSKSKSTFSIQSVDLNPNSYLSNQNLVYTDTEMLILKTFAISRMKVKSAVHESQYSRFTFDSKQINNEARNIHNSAYSDGADPQLASGGMRVYFENALAFVNQPGEWFLDRGSGTVYLYTRTEDRAEAGGVIAPRLTTLLRINGSTSTDHIQDISVENIEFRHSDWKRPLNEGFFSRQAARATVGPGAERAHKGVPAAIEIYQASNIALAGCRFSQFGTSGIEIGPSTSQVTIEKNLFGDIAGNAVSAQPVYEGDASHKIEGTVIRDNRFHYIGESYAGVGILMGFTQNTEIKNNELDTIAYSGISMGWWIHPHSPIVDHADQEISHNKI
ncbi:MAG: right-handed parallel beta-helix repeat-containing protein, partial [Bdellovibrionales bacterium]